MGECGVYGNDVHMDWCPDKSSCPSEVSVSTSVCSTGTAELFSFQGTGGWASVTRDGCSYGFFAQYACTSGRRLRAQSSQELARAGRELPASSPQSGILSTNHVVIAALCISSLLVATSTTYTLLRWRKRGSSSLGKLDGPHEPTLKDLELEQQLMKHGSDSAGSASPRSEVAAVVEAWQV
jgi:hypothetical protein